MPVAASHCPDGGSDDNKIIIRLHGDKYLVGDGDAHGPVGRPPGQEGRQTLDLGGAKVSHALEGAQGGHGSKKLVLEGASRFVA